MSNTPKSKRKKHDFETTKQMKALRKDITETVINDFGYDKERYRKKIERFAEARKGNPNAEKAVERMKWKQENFYDAFIDKESDVILSLWFEIVSEFEEGNSIFPSGFAVFVEYCERRLHLDRCIGKLNALKCEIEFLAETLPVDKNKYDGFADRIKALVSMVKGVRQSSNRFLKVEPDGVAKKFIDFIKKELDKLTDAA